MNSEIALPRGYTLHEYRIESTLGVGGFGLTYLATDSNLNVQVAIKEYLPGELAIRRDDQSVRSKSDATLDTFQWGLTRFLEESRTLASFHHPNIVRVMRFFEANQTAYMVMEFVAGQPLNEWIKARRPLPEPAITSIASALLDGVEVVHRAGYLHRDIKPGNIFIRDDATPVLLDFGSARVASAHTERTAIISPGYAPLEQYHTHGNQGPWSDLYALGGVLYWIVTGEKPVEATARFPSDPLRPATRAGDRSHYSQQLLEAIDWALMPTEAARPQSVAALRQVLLRHPSASALHANSMLTGQTSMPDAFSPTTRIATGPAMDSEALANLSRDLAGHIGPIAALVVKSAARKALTPGQLVEMIAAEINDKGARADFVRKHAAPEHAASGNNCTHSTPSRTLPTGPPSAAQRFDAHWLSRVEMELAKAIGAVARAVVKRAAAKAHSESELLALLANEIENPIERKAFSRKMPSVSGRE